MKIDFKAAHGLCAAFAHRCFSVVKVFLDKRCVLAYNIYNKNITKTYDGEK